MKELFIACATPKRKEETLLWKSVEKLISCKILKEENYKFFEKNDRNLATVYNEILRNPKVDGKILILVHDDVRIDDVFISEKLNAMVSAGIQVVSLAGIERIFEVYEDGFGRSPFICDDVPMMWHLMGSKLQRHGEVSHFWRQSQIDINTPSYTSVYGMNGPVKFFDGVFMAIDVDSMPDRKMFDEECPSRFHFYDLNFCLNCILTNVKCATCSIKITHASPGGRNMGDEFWNGERYFRGRILRMLGKIRYGN